MNPRLFISSRQPSRPSTPRRTPVLLFVAVWLAACFPSTNLLADNTTPTAEQVEFFEAHIRPLLVERCHDCHAADLQEAGLRLDSRAALLTGGDTGPAAIPGQPDQSRLMQVVHYRGDVQMPPDAKLSNAEIEALAHWINDGLPWPPAASPAGESSAAEATTASNRLARLRAEHWSLQPIVRPDIPQVEHTPWPQRTLDYFILARLEDAGLTPSPAADKRTFLRRATYDLLGLPPTHDEVEQFLTDDSVEAYERLIDRYLASPAYGQRWGRHWLDVARYADTKGYVFTAEPRFPYAFTYRDYVVRALNEDLPFDRFVLEQLAADQLELGADKRPLAALGYLTLGRRFDNNIHDMIDDRIDVVTRGLLGLTVSCARCHDHKYDPIPTADYYSLYGVFASSVEPDELPLISMPDEVQAFESHQQQLAAAESELDTFLQEHHTRITEELRTHVTDYLVHIVTHKPETDLDEQAFLSLNAGEIKPKIADRWRALIAARTTDPIFALWHKLASLPADHFAEQASQLLANLHDTGRLADEVQVNSLVRENFISQPPQSMVEVAGRYGQLLTSTWQAWHQLLAAHQQTAEGTEPAEPPQSLPDAEAESIRQLYLTEDSPLVISRDQLPRLLDRAAWSVYTQRLGAVEQLKADTPVALSRAMVLVDAEKPHEPRIFQRGNPARPGDTVPRQYLEMLSPDERRPFSQGSGRLELARAITSLDNPLTARVIVNRVWLHHFSQGLVRTPDDFGTRSEPPTHPELLDYLAFTFRADGWSLKKLHRQIMLSSTYRQASDHRADCAVLDPDNRFVWRYNRRRLEFEPLRDSLMAVADHLDLSLDGRAVDLFAQPYTTRRTIYGFVDRQDVPGVLRSFDFTDPDATTSIRPQTVVPNRPFMMNSLRPATGFNISPEQVQLAIVRTRGRFRPCIARFLPLLKSKKSRSPNNIWRPSADDAPTAWLMPSAFRTNEFTLSTEPCTARTV